MSGDSAKLLKKALALPAEARAALADCLLASLDAEVDEGYVESVQVLCETPSGD